MICYRPNLSIRIPQWAGAGNTLSVVTLKHLVLSTQTLRSAVCLTFKILYKTKALNAPLNLLWPGSPRQTGAGAFTVNLLRLLKKHPVEAHHVSNTNFWTPLKTRRPLSTKAPQTRIYRTKSLPLDSRVDAALLFSHTLFKMIWLNRRNKHFDTKNKLN